jgi:hypothetical protein
MAQPPRHEMAGSQPAKAENNGLIQIKAGRPAIPFN